MTHRETRLVLLSTDLAGYARAAEPVTPLAVADFLDDWYRRTAEVIRGHGGRVVKFIGDGCLATFPEDAAVAAVDAAAALLPALDPLAEAHRMKVEVSANVHLALVAEGEFGPDDDRRYDVLGCGVNQLFLLGSGPGVRISEAIHAELPDERRSAWRKHDTLATYTLFR